MRQTTTLTALLLSAGGVAADSNFNPYYPPPTPASPACAQVSSAWAAQIKTNPTPTVAASLAFDCLNSVPLHREEAIQLVDAIKPYLDYQSDTAYKADPPPSYYFPGYDIYGNLAKVRAKLVAGFYKNEIDFQQDLYLTVFAKGHDGHFVFYPDALTKVFKYKRQISLVSVSEDGNLLPVIKVYEDVLANPQKASAVKAINGVPAEKYVLDTIAEATFNQDIDAAYNTMYYGPALYASAPGLRGYFNGGGRSGYFYRGPTTSLTFANGTKSEFSNIAAVTANMTGVTDGPSFYKAFCIPKPLPPTSDEAKAPPAIDQVTIPGYPPPVIASSDGVASGYFLDGEGLEDVAVLALLSFEPAIPAEFQAVCQEFFKLAKAAGKTKLVVDLQGNGGGYILLGYDFFRQLFPHVVQDGNSRWKGSKAFLSVAKAFSEEAAHVDPYTSSDIDAIGDYLTWYNYRYDLNLTNQNFPDFDAKFAPHVYQDTSYTALMRWNLSDPLTTVNDTFGMGMEITGYGSLSNVSQPFNAEDIVLVYDGLCGSTCTIASEMLRIQGGVRSIAFGGRPIHGPIQGVGGVKGSQVLAFSDVYSISQRAINITTDASIKKDLAKFSPLPIQRSTAASLNVRDQILRDNVNDGLPAQYVVENADCRLYWTAEMVANVSNIWKAAANSAFNGHKCAYGGIGQDRAAAMALKGRPDLALMKELASAASEKLAGIRRKGFEPRLEMWQAIHNQKCVD